ncbi:hypothetical protein ABZ924_26210 [Streptomyces sp. NPDC046876]|uniref:hypothetical protein n=1 Tax=Streptomyces sp. NPDC046876 TaxID=3155616 RepID=UPI0033C1957D
MARQQQNPSDADRSWRRCAPPPALSGFLALLVLVFAVSYGVGSVAGPVAPGMHADETVPVENGSPGGHGHGHGGPGGAHSGGTR